MAARKKLEPPAESVQAFDIIGAQLFNEAFTAWQKSVGDIEIVARETRTGAAAGVELIYWRPKKKNMTVGVTAARRLR